MAKRYPTFQPVLVLERRHRLSLIGKPVYLWVSCGLVPLAFTAYLVWLLYVRHNLSGLLTAVVAFTFWSYRMLAGGRRVVLAHASGAHGGVYDNDLASLVVSALCSALLAYGVHVYAEHRFAAGSDSGPLLQAGCEIAAFFLALVPLDHHCCMLLGQRLGLREWWDRP